MYIYEVCFLVHPASVYVAVMAAGSKPAPNQRVASGFVNYAIEYTTSKTCTVRHPYDARVVIENRCVLQVANPRLTNASPVLRFRFSNPYLLFFSRLRAFFIAFESCMLSRFFVPGWFVPTEKTIHA